MLSKLRSILKSRRLWGVWIFPVLVITWLFGTDPNKDGASTYSMLQGIATGLLVVTCTHVARKILFDYIELEEFVREAKRSPTGAGLVVLGVLIFMLGLLFVFAPRAHAQDVRAYVPAGAFKYAPMLKAEQLRIWSDHPMPSALGALVEQESCISLKHSRCWDPEARLKTDREEGAGFGQITRAYHADGSIRFDALDTVRRLDPGLSQWSWDNVYRRPDLQLRALVVMNYDCYRRISRLVDDKDVRIQMCDAAYNGGWAGLQQERRACGLRSGCDPQRWFGHVEATCLKSKVRWRGYGKSACEINREHVEMVTVVRRPKYEPLLGGVPQ
ncbi:MAG TPA: hypothetical protein VEC06_08590 [Paucimonas sp.]|nr:hypothetical protein [Paucimonas sp.]